jgi:hypothetical protein
MGAAAATAVGCNKWTCFNFFNQLATIDDANFGLRYNLTQIKIAEKF